MATFLNEQQVAQYNREGYLSPLPAIGAERAKAFKAEFDAFQSSGDPDTEDLLRSKPHLIFPSLFDLISDPVITDPVTSILGPNLLAWGTSFFAKNAGDPGYVSWHQDANYWGLEPHEVLTAWIAFSPSHRENGCMRIVPGSHLGEALEHRDTFAKGNLLSRGQEIAVDVNEDQAADITLEPGEMSLHHVGIVHGSEPNTGTVPRIGFAIRYIATHVQQHGGRTTATLARGIDEFDHFDLETRPEALNDRAGRNHRQQALEMQHKVLYAGVDRDATA